MRAGFILTRIDNAMYNKDNIVRLRFGSEGARTVYPIPGAAGLSHAVFAACHITRSSIVATSGKPASKVTNALMGFP